MSTIRTERLSENVGAKVLDVDADRLSTDPDLPTAVAEALEKYGVLLFPELHATDEAMAGFCARLGTLIDFSHRPPANEKVMEISFDPSNPNAEYLRSNEFWHIDGLLDEIAPKTSILTARVTSAEGGETEFASTYAAYDELSDEERQRFAELRVVHTFDAVQRMTYTDPTPEQLADWATRTAREHPLVWEHDSGRRSLVLGATASHIVGMDVDEGKALLAELRDRVTGPGKVCSHSWTEGDTVFWDNTGLVHRVREFDRDKPRVMHRLTVAGEEKIK
ncbi:TauD/TfdA dioxygenase family protein [Gordonia insulae]|uniref:Alpha-ketoglutarate-dependent sulfate ester dioxygenase n=1 Tax=Gordonia insulae TaxID=2420509 RepID=A0A3G8JL07_9ACTN|nr:TauD/TfdA family dioxygenase [Gordonia insulae]AZG45119.1 Alpha-ketoglutarate-dependent sulfate ester dioxygenase [Gordonia insulae]